VTGQTSIGAGRRGRVAVVTGANSGLGLATARALAATGATVILACRDPVRAARARRDVASVATGEEPAVVALDLADLASVREAASAVGRRYGAIDVLVNNAGVMAVPPMLTADGFEMQFGTNHLGPFALTGLLLPILLATPGARVVTVSSLAAWQADVVPDDLQSERAYDPWRAYARSKRANLLMAFELDRRSRAAGADLRSVAAHPGWAATELVRNGPGRWTSATGRVVYATAGLLARPASRAAGPQVLAATGPDVEGGSLVGPRWWLRGRPVIVRPPRGARSTEMALALWRASEELTGVRGPLAAP
jgi:NAD(P)-dependent dehydrogenase (short-subunit alcohol dehydrogenase family)